MFLSRHFQPYSEIHTFNPNHDMEILHQQLEDDMLRMRDDMERRMQWMQQAFQFPPDHLDLRRKAIESRVPTTHGEMLLNRPCKRNFELSLDVDQVPPEEMTVKTEGRRLIVMGKQDMKKETGNNGFVHEHREWRREAELPEDVNPKDVLCSMSRDGRLHFQAPRLALPAANHRSIPISRDMHIPIMMDSKWTLY